MLGCTCTSAPNLVIPAWAGYDLWLGQAPNEINLDYKVKFNLAPPPPPPPNPHPHPHHHQFKKRGKIGILTEWVTVMARTSSGWTHARTHDTCTHTRTHGQTDAGNDNTRRPQLVLGKKGHMLFYDWHYSHNKANYIKTMHAFLWHISWALSNEKSMLICPRWLMVLDCVSPIQDQYWP